ncbi:DUF423 domain-containing protein [Sphingosinicella sp. LY1275]|uniref:DUF423 domain-containing protein n=1 Tax=Sphingosinicella sp. LY1275 TaxID=3095379 RepID=UPI002ADEF110|nr:DUF423 domain-containing protein [Sphingosinicella sp. LY1275]MEA1015895.1 DUF423 domain-containing protein [Sphingosinicella sp. LY1275]
MTDFPEQRRILLTGSLLAALGVAFGAFGAHGLRDMLDSAALGWWQTAVQWHMWHAIGLVALAAAPWPRLGRAAALLAIGTLVFSGSLYLMALTGARWLGMVTPLGGMLMIAGWATVAWSAWRGPRA